MGETILVVDDEEGIRKLMDITLSDMGYSVHTAENGESALAIFRRIHPPIVLLDIRMPGMDGIELLRTMKAEQPDTEVVMITGHGDLDLAIKSIKYEATDFVTKPINMDILEIALKRAKEKISTRHQLREYTENLENLVREKSERLVRAERLAAVGQVVEAITSSTKNMAEDLDVGIKFFNEMPCLVSIHNRDLKVVATNQLFKERLGDKIGSDSCEIYTEGAGGREECPALRTFETGKGVRSRETIRKSNGEEMPVIVHTAPITGGDSDVELVLEISADVSEVQRLQEELRTTQRRYQQLFDEAPCYITVQDRDLRLMAVNRQFKEDFGDGMGSHCYEVYRHRNTPCPNCPVADTFEDGESHQSEIVVTSKKGEQNNVLIWTAPIRDAEGRIVQVMEMSTNITQLRKLQDHLTSLGLLIGSISHGVKGLLTGLDGAIYRVELGLKKKNMEQIESGWDVVRLMVDRIRNMVLDILYFAKKRDLKWERVDVLSLARDVAATVEPKMGGHEIEFVRDFDPSVGQFEVDPGVVSSALINILENAVDACIENGSKERHKIMFGVKEEDNEIVFHVKDDGIGMDRDTRENMFTLFFSSKGTRGTGLGLFISNQIIQQHGGAIKVDSEPGQGSHFYIRMPKTLPEGAKTPKSEIDNGVTVDGPLSVS